MKKNNNVFPGAILIVLGVIFLGYNYDLFEFELTFRKIAKFWPIMIILAGVAVFFTEKKTVYNATSALLIAFAIPMAIYSLTSDGIDKIETEINDSIEFDEDENNDEEDFESESSNDIDSTQTSQNQNFNVGLGPDVTEANLEIGGGAAEFHLEETNANLFEAKTQLKNGSYKLSEEKNGNVHDIDFEMSNLKRKNKDITIDKELSNDVYLKLNKKPNWNIDLKVGAGDLDFDLSKYKVIDLKVKTGAASVKLKLGDLVNNSNVKIESGAANVVLMIPKDVACEINMDGLLNDKNFIGFEQKEDDKWRTSNFSTGKKKILIDLESGMSAIKVERY